MSSTQDGFYKKEINPATGDSVQRIADPEDAHVIALVAENSGMGPARALEKEMYFQRRTGLDPSFKGDFETMEELYNTYPYAFEQGITPKGVRYINTGALQLDDPDKVRAVTAMPWADLSWTGFSPEKIVLYQEFKEISSKALVALRDLPKSVICEGETYSTEEIITVLLGGIGNSGKNCVYFSQYGLTIQKDSNQDIDALIGDPRYTLKDSIRVLPEGVVSLIKEILEFYNRFNKQVQAESSNK